MTENPDREAVTHSDEHTCSFCGKPRHEVKKLVSGPNGVTICNECAELCLDITNEQATRALGDDDDDAIVQRSGATAPGISPGCAVRAALRCNIFPAREPGAAAVGGRTSPRDGGQRLGQRAGSPRCGKTASTTTCSPFARMRKNTAKG